MCGLATALQQPTGRGATSGSFPPGQMGRLGKVSRGGRNRQDAVFFPAGCRISEDNVNSSSTAKTILFWISIVFLGIMLWKLVSANGNAARGDEPSYSEFMARVDAGDIKEVTLYPSPNSYELTGEYIRPADRSFHLTVPKEVVPALMGQLREKGVSIKVKEARSADWTLILLNAAPLILLVGFCLFLMWQMKGNAKRALVLPAATART